MRRWFWYGAINPISRCYLRCTNVVHVEGPRVTSSSGRGLIRIPFLRLCLFFFVFREFIIIIIIIIIIIGFLVLVSSRRSGKGSIVSRLAKEGDESTETT